MTQLNVILVCANFNRFNLRDEVEFLCNAEMKAHIKLQQLSSIKPHAYSPSKNEVIAVGDSHAIGSSEELMGYLSMWSCKIRSKHQGSYQEFEC
jgi:hypothetical protein